MFSSVFVSGYCLDAVLAFRLIYYFGSGVTWENAGQIESGIMTEYIVGLRQGKRSEVLTIEAEDALIAALKVKHNHPDALISYVRKSNRSGDRRNPHRKE
ncbi:MAG: hypothetical protein WBG10_03980 [Pseudolabrys sp.]